MGELAGRTAVITGASRGIGLATAQAMAAAGAQVVLTARTQAAADAGAAQVVGEALGFAAHAVDEAAASACFDFTVENFGSVDILVNNAGTSVGYGPLSTPDHARFRKTFDLNLWAPVLWTALAVRAWMGEHGGVVVNNASTGGLIVEQDCAIYNASKAALMHLTRHSAAEFGPQVRVNAVAPGIVRTRLSAPLWENREAEVAAQYPLRRIGEPCDVASAIVFLASDASSWVTGQTLVIDGGSTL